jgi:hypothetical protein
MGSTLRSGFDGGFDTGIGATAADIAAHSGLDLLVTGAGITFQQGGSAHDLPGLAIPTLGYVYLQPGFLDRMVPMLRESLDGGDGFVADCGYRQLAGSHRYAIQVNGTGTTHGHTAAVLGTHEIKVVTQYP